MYYVAAGAEMPHNPRVRVPRIYIIVAGDKPTETAKPVRAPQVQICVHLRAQIYRNGLRRAYAEIVITSQPCAALRRPAIDRPCAACARGCPDSSQRNKIACARAGGSRRRIRGGRGGRRRNGPRQSRYDQVKAARMPRRICRRLYDVAAGSQIPCRNARICVSPV